MSRGTDATGTEARGDRRTLAAIALTAVNLRTAVTGFSVLIDAAANALAFGPLIAGAIGTIVTACFALAAFAAPALARRLGLERTAAIALIATTLGILLRAVAWSPEVLILGTVVAFAGVGTSNVVLVPIVRARFASRLKSVSTLYMVLLQLGQLVAPIVAIALAGTAGWRVAAGVWAVATGAAAVLWIVVARGTASHPAAPAARIATRRRGLLAGLIGLMSMTALHTYTIVSWLPTMLTDAGVDAAQGALLLSWFAALGLGAAFVAPPLATRMRNPYPVVVVCAALLAAGYGILWADPLSGGFAAATALGLGVSTFPLCLTLIAARATDAADAARLSGLVQGAGYGIGCVGPIGLGLVNESSGDWASSYALLIATLSITLVAGWFACRPARSLPMV